MAADLGLLQHLLDRLEKHWQAVNAPVIELARPGLTTEEIDERTAPLGLRLPVEARYWFAWHDGVEPALADQAQMGPSFYLPSLEYQILSYLDERQFAVEAFQEGWAETPDQLWEPSWFPIFGRSIGRSPAIVDVGVAEGELTPIGHATKESVDPPGRGRTLTSLVQFWVECHDQGLYRWQPEERNWVAARDAPSVAAGPYNNLYM
jgi:hypothetical protein